MSQQQNQLKILLIDDNEDHAKILKWSFEKSGRHHQITFIEEGSEALALLGVGQRAQPELPDLILLDFNLPKIDGREVLRILKSDERTKRVPVIVMSSSDREEDIRKAYELGASTYVSKSDVLGEKNSFLSTLHEYWSTIAKLPGR